jgi:eukaryotic-like serine/threonine-protein kinase
MNDLEEQLASRALPLEEALRYAASLAELLRQTHRHGTVCGCLDPKNIVWDNHDLKLVQTEAGGTGAYLAPEQVRGETADARSDIFAFGAIIYELLSGRRAFPAQDPEELKKQVLEYSPPALEGIPEGISSLLSGCLEKNRDLRWQRVSSILIELKLANASARQAHSASEWKDKVLSLRSQVAGHDERLAAQQMTHESFVAELRQSIRRLEETQAAIQESIAGLQKGAQVHTKAIEGLQVAASQTDEVVEHVVEAFGMMHKSMEERGEAKVLLVARNGS